MPQKILIEDVLKKKERTAVVDVRSPSEYAKGHIPGAFNIPLFNDSERAVVGKEYHRHGPARAILSGLKIARPKMKKLVSEATKISSNSSLLVHCWRGGMRSENMALLFRISGIHCDILMGGYKSYRHYLREVLSGSLKMIIIGGYTGSGKTEILRNLFLQGQQIIDLEGIAHHKGSAFGALGQERQPSNEQFENNLFEHYRLLNLNEPVWFEDESRAIGSVFIPDEIFTQMRISPVVKVDLDLQLRVKRLEKEYANFPSDVLKKSIEKISKRLGDENRRIALAAIDQSDFAKAIELSLAYYDKSYGFGLSRRDDQSIHSLQLTRDDSSENARKVMQFAKQRNLI